MLSKLIFFLTCISYLGLVYINLYKPKGTGDQMVGWAFIIFIVLAVYVLCSLALTISLASSGKLDWVADTNSARIILIGLGWLCISSAIYHITSMNGDWKSVATANFLGLSLVHFGAVWIPLLMLLPYFYLINQEGHTTLLPLLYKVPLLIGCVIGLFFQGMSNVNLAKIFRDQKAINQLEHKEALEEIEYTERVTDLLYYTYKGTDTSLMNAAVVKINKIENLDEELIKILDTHEMNADFLRVLAYLENNAVKNPDLFIEPLNKIILKIALELHYRLQSYANETGYLELLNVDGLCNILNKQFANHRNDFKVNMQKIKDELDIEPRPDFLEIRNKYREAINLWLIADNN